MRPRSEPVKSLVTLEELELYAQTYFNDAFDKLPTITTFRFQNQKEKHNNLKSSDEIAGVKLLIGRDSYKPDKKIFAYANVTYNTVEFKIGLKRSLRGLNQVYFRSHDLYEPFKFLVHDFSIYRCAPCYFELEQYLLFLFMKKGLLKKTDRIFCLPLFELACEAIATKIHTQPYNDDKLRALDEIAQANLVSCLRSKMVVTDPEPSHLLTAEPKISLNRVNVGSKRPVSEMARGSSEVYG
jgi:hypothetical protein